MPHNEGVMSAGKCASNYLFIHVIKACSYRGRSIHFNTLHEFSLAMPRRPLVTARLFPRAFSLIRVCHASCAECWRFPTEARVAARDRETICGFQSGVCVCVFSRRNAGRFRPPPGHFFPSACQLFAGTWKQRSRLAGVWRRVAKQPVKIDARENAKILISLAKRSGHVDRARDVRPSLFKDHLLRSLQRTRLF